MSATIFPKRLGSAIMAGWLGMIGIAAAAGPEQAEVVVQASFGRASLNATSPGEQPFDMAPVATTPVSATSPPPAWPVSTVDIGDALPGSVDGIGVAVAIGSLDALRGGDGNVDNDIRVDGQVDGNDIDNVVTGDNAILGGSFANANGLTTVIQNTGAGVLIQNAMIVNVQFADPGP